LAEDIGPGDVGTIAVQRAAHVDQHHVAIGQGLILGHTVGIGRRLAELHGGEQRVQAKRMVGGGDERP
jgi:hypothetical protein